MHIFTPAISQSAKQNRTTPHDVTVHQSEAQMVHDVKPYVTDPFLLCWVITQVIVSKPAIQFVWIINEFKKPITYFNRLCLCTQTFISDLCVFCMHLKESMYCCASLQSSAHGWGTAFTALLRSLPSAKCVSCSRGTNPNFCSEN